MLKKIISHIVFFCTLSTHLLGEGPSQTEAIEDWSYTLALQAATYGAPLVTMYALRDLDAIGPNAKAAPNTIWRMEDISTPKLSEEAGYVTPNVNVIYGFGFVDLRGGPVILEVPNSNGRYYMVQIVDMWTNAFAYVGGKTTGYKGGKFTLVGPNWKGSLPKGAVRIDCPTPWVLVQPRVHVYVNGGMDLPGAKAILRKIQLTPLKGFTKQGYPYPSPHVLDPTLPVSVLKYQDPLQFWELLMVAMNENPPPKDQIASLLPMFEPLGIHLGQRWDRSKIAPEILEAMRKAALDIGAILDVLPSGIIYKGALIPPPTIGNFGTDYKTRAITSRVGLTANTPYESVYWMYTHDNQGEPLTGEKNYVMVFKEAPPFYSPGFWSITMYDSTNNYTIQNPIHRYMVGSDTKNLKKKPGGSFILYIQNQSPGIEKESNWLPSPKGPFYLISRVYAPKPEIIQILETPKSWPIPAITNVP